MESFEILAWETFISAVGFGRSISHASDFRYTCIIEWITTWKATTDIMLGSEQLHANDTTLQFLHRYHIGCSISKPAEASFSFWSISYHSWTFATFVSSSSGLNVWIFMRFFMSTLSHAEYMRVIFLFEISDRLPIPNYFFMVWFIHPVS